MAVRPVIVVGASAGGVEALRDLVASLPAEFPAPVLVTLHLPSEASSVLADILSRAGPLPAEAAQSGREIEPGRIYVAPADRHLLVEDGRIRLSAGPKENGSRPAIDPMFRSAAHAHDGGAVGIILSGTRDDGVAGLAAIKRHGGVTMVQDPADALFPVMPTGAIETVPVDQILPASKMGAALTDLMQKGGALPVAENSARRSGEIDPVERQAPTSEEDLPGEPSPFACPDCGGVMWEGSEDGVHRYRCRTGHAYSGDALLSKQGEALEDLLWSAIRALEENADLAERLAGRMRSSGHNATAMRFEQRALDARRRAAALQDLIRAEIASVAREEPADA